MLTNFITNECNQIKVYIFLIFYLFIFRERRWEGAKGMRNIYVWEKQQSVASRTPSTVDLACNPGTCPDRKLNGWPFVSQAGAQSTEPHQPGQSLYFYFTIKWLCKISGRYQILLLYFIQITINLWEVNNVIP